MFPFIPVIIQHRVSGEILLLAYLSKGEWQSLQKGQALSLFFNEVEAKWMGEKNATKPLIFDVADFTEDVTTATLLILAEPVTEHSACYLSPFASLTPEITELYRLNRLVRFHAQNRTRKVSEISGEYSAGSFTELEKAWLNYSGKTQEIATTEQIKQAFIEHLIFLSYNQSDLLDVLNSIRDEVYG